jgi:hypothetical protein
MDLFGSGTDIKLKEKEKEEALRKKKWNSENYQIDGFVNFPPPLLYVNVLFCRFCKKSHPIYDQTQDSKVVFSLICG